jgi:hypothetical protein
MASIAPDHALILPNRANPRGCDFRERQEETRDPLLHALDQQQDALLNAPQLAGGQGEELAGNRGVAPGQRRQRLALDHQHFRVGDRFGRAGVLVGKFETENVAGQIKSADLSAPVAEDLVRATPPLTTLYR